MAHSVGARIGIGTLIAVAVTVLTLSPFVWLAGWLSCQIDGSYGCGWGSLYGLVATPLFGLLCGLGFVAIDWDAHERQRIRAWYSTPLEGDEVPVIDDAEGLPPETASAP